MAAANPFRRMWDFMNAYEDNEDYEPMSPTSQKTQTPTSSPATKRQRGNLTLHANQEGGMTIRHPQHMDERKLVGDDLRLRRIVTLNLTRLPDTDARLFLEFISGVSYALDAEMKKVHDGIFLIIPRGVVLHNDVDETEPMLDTASFTTTRCEMPKVNPRGADQEELFWQER